MSTIAEHIDRMEAKLNELWEAATLVRSEARYLKAIERARYYYTDADPDITRYGAAGTMASRVDGIEDALAELTEATERYRYATVGMRPPPAAPKDRARMAWYVYAAPVGDSASGEEVATDMVADLLYIMRENGVEDVGRVLERALMHYTHETSDLPG